MAALEETMRLHTTLPALALLATGCAATMPRPAAPAAAAERELTAGLVQKDVREGMSAAEVVEALGSPNVVTRDGDGFEVWVWDRVATARIRNSRTLSGGGAGFGVAPVGAGLIEGAAWGHGSAAYTEDVSSQRTLTVVVRFDAKARVTAVSLHATRF
jgi:outer membrane protein assembly factor BamE (lipoprotein component of BamABCDE complex)